MTKRSAISLIEKGWMIGKDLRKRPLNKRERSQGETPKEKGKTSGPSITGKDLRERPLEY
jgi:hypothetical protein